MGRGTFGSMYQRGNWGVEGTDSGGEDRTKEDGGVARDMLLVEGTAIVNEAMLSGESTPLLKDSVRLRPRNAPIDPEGPDQNAFLYGGTKVLQVTQGNAISQ